ncbi:MAG: reverse transcriptase domain-containing protein [Candidatus Omnitrophota bacterium]|jgi:RNA-directed DNA polymerase
MNLLQKIAKKENLFLAWSRINQKPRSHGIDNETIQSFKENLYLNIKNINKSLLAGGYHFSPYKGQKLEKKGKTRILKIPTVKDRIVQRAIRNVIEKRFTSDFLECSFGYIERLGIKDAVEKILKFKDDGNYIVLEADIQKFFDTVDKEKLFALIMNKFKKDSGIEKLLREALNSEIGNPEIFNYTEIEGLNNSEIGIPQGGILSPLFANIYLSDFDKKILATGYKLIRYADDFIVLCKSKEEAKAAHVLCKEILEGELYLKLHPLDNSSTAKTRISDFKQGFKYLGIQFGYDYICPSEPSRNNFKNRIEELTNYNKVSSLVGNFKELSLVIYGWGNVYNYCKNQKTREIFMALDEYVLKRINLLLKELYFLSKTYYLSNRQLDLLKIPKLINILDKAQ